jgi:hypothetical protein
MPFACVCVRWVEFVDNWDAGPDAAGLVRWSPRGSGGDVVRWDALFDDLEAQAAAHDRAERAAEVAERTRMELGTVGWADRARAAVGSAVRVRLPGDQVVAGALTRVGPDWLLLDDGGGRETVVRTAAVLTMRGFARYAAIPGAEGAVASRLGLRHVLRAVARDRSAVRLHLLDGSTVDATLDRVGADFVEVATHGAGELRRRSEVRDVELIMLTAIAALRRAG